MIRYFLWAIQNYRLSYPSVSPTSSTIVDVPYGAVAINLSIVNPTNKLDIINLKNWDLGLLDLEARVAKIEKNSITGCKYGLP